MWKDFSGEREVKKAWHQRKPRKGRTVHYIECRREDKSGKNWSGHWIWWWDSHCYSWEKLWWNGGCRKKTVVERGASGSWGNGDVQFRQLLKDLDWKENQSQKAGGKHGVKEWVCLLLRFSDGRLLNMYKCRWERAIWWEVLQMQEERWVEASKGREGDGVLSSWGAVGHGQEGGRMSSWDLREGTRMCRGWGSLQGWEMQWVRIWGSFCPMAFVFTVMRKQGHKSRVTREVMNRDLKKREEVLKVENVRESTGGREKDLGDDEKRVLWLSPAASNSPGAGFT